MTTLPQVLDRKRHLLVGAGIVVLAATVAVVVQHRPDAVWLFSAWHRQDVAIGQPLGAGRTDRSSATTPASPIAANPVAALEDAAVTAATHDERIARQAAILAAWARRSPQHAWAWLRNHVAFRASSGEIPPIVAMLQAILARDPTLAMSFVNTSRGALPDPADQRQITYDAVVALLTTGHVDLARAAIDEWLQQREPVDERTLTVAVFALAAAHSPAGAADWLTQLPGAERYGAVAAALAANWAERDPAAALDWAQTLPTTTQREAAMSRVFAVWSDHDATGATQWFLQHESLPESDRLIPTFIDKSNLGSTDPAAAMAWASLPRDASLRSASFAIALRQWADRDPQAAAQFLAQTTALPANDRTRLTAELGLPNSSQMTDRP